MWVLATEPGSSARVANALNHYHLSNPSKYILRANKMKRYICNIFDSQHLYRSLIKQEKDPHTMYAEYEQIIYTRINTKVVNM